MPKAFGKVHPRFQTPARLDDRRRRRRRRLVRVLQPHVPELPVRLAHGAGDRDRLLLLAHRLRLRDLPPQGAHEVREELLLHRRRAGHRGNDPGRPVLQGHLGVQERRGLLLGHGGLRRRHPDGARRGPDPARDRPDDRSGGSPATTTTSGARPRPSIPTWRPGARPASRPCPRGASDERDRRRVRRFDRVQGGARRGRRAGVLVGGHARDRLRLRAAGQRRRGVQGAPRGAHGDRPQSDRRGEGPGRRRRCGRPGRAGAGTRRRRPPVARGAPRRALHRRRQLRRERLEGRDPRLDPAQAGALSPVPVVVVPA